MRIGWLCRGYNRTDIIAADGAANIRMPIIQRLIKNNHTIFWLGNVNKNLSHSHMILFNEDKYYKLQKEINKQNYKEFIKNYDFSFLPDIDVLFFETNEMGFFGYYASGVINYYYRKGIKILILDEDNLYSNYKTKLKIFNIDINDILILTPYSKIKNKKQKIMYYPYNKDNELPIIHGKNIAYIGNDYRRREKLKQFYNTLLADIYGKYVDAEFNQTVACIIKERIAPNQVHKTYQKYAMSIQIVRKDYSNIGLMTQRINEVLESGTLLYADIQISGIQKFVQPKYLIINQDDVLREYERVTNLNSIEYCEEVTKQREYLQKNATTYEDYIKLIEGE